MKLVELKPIHDDSGQSTSPLQTDAMGSNAHIPLTQQPMNTLQKDFLWLLLEPLHHHWLDIFVSPESKTFSTFPSGSTHRNNTLKHPGYIDGSPTPCNISWEVEAMWGWMLMHKIMKLLKNMAGCFDFIDVQRSLRILHSCALKVSGSLKVPRLWQGTDSCNDPQNT